MKALLRIVITSYSIHYTKLYDTTDIIWLEGGLFSREQLSTMVAEAKYDLLPEEMQSAMAHLEAKLKIAEEPQLVSVYADYGYHAHCLTASRNNFV